MCGRVEGYTVGFVSVGAELPGTGNRERAGLPVWKSSFHLDQRPGSVEDICIARGKSLFGSPFPSPVYFVLEE